MAILNEIKSSTLVIDIIENYPEMTDYFLDLGICGCGHKSESDYYWTIERVAGEKGIDMKTLLKELNEKIQ